VVMMSNDFPSVAFVDSPNLRDQITQAVADAVPSAPVQDSVQPVHDSGQVDSVEAAAILGVTANNLRQMVHKRQIIPVGKRGRRTIFNRADVEALRERRSK
jgi:hypothetical protein